MQTNGVAHTSTAPRPCPVGLAEIRAALAGADVGSGAAAGPWAPIDGRESSARETAATPWDLVSGGGLHEWFAGDAGSLERSDGGGAGAACSDRPGGLWLPPMAVLIGLAWQALEADPRRRVVWIGRRCWPYPPALLRWDRPRHGASEADHVLIERSIFVDVASSRVGHAERVWAIELAARCAGVGAVVADGTGLTMAESRRLQLAARSSPLFLARPPWEARALSAARTRWRVAPMPFIDHTPRESETCEGRRHGWTLELLRCKGVRADRVTEEARPWAVRRDHATARIKMERFDRPPGNGDLAAQVVDRSDPSARARIA